MVFADLSSDCELKVAGQKPPCRVGISLFRRHRAQGREGIDRVFESSSNR